MSDSDSEDNHERNTPPAPNQNKEVKQEQVKEEKEKPAYKRLSDISAPKRRKILHKLMKKYHRDPFYQPIDIAKKIIKKLKVNHSQYIMSRIKADMNKWVAENDPDSDSDESDDNTPDSKKRVSRDIKTKKESARPELVNSEEAPKEIPVTQQKEESVPEEAEPSGVSKKVDDKKPASVTNNVPLIDLTVEIKKEIKEEVLTIDDDCSSMSDKKGTAQSIPVNPPGGLPVYPYPVYGYNPAVPYYPEAYYRPYYPNPYWDPSLYNPHMMYDPYFYNPYHQPYAPSDLLPNYPVDPDSAQNPKLANDMVNQPKVNSAPAPSDANNTSADANAKEVPAAQQETRT